jgi:hypothetical protein
VRHRIDRLAADMAEIPGEAITGMARIVEDNAKYGRDLARADAKVKAGKAGVHYPKSITAEPITPLSWEYGPDPAKKQGGMDFEYGSGRQTTPHLSLAISADKIAPSTAADIRKLITRLFW